MSDKRKLVDDIEEGNREIVDPQQGPQENTSTLGISPYLEGIDPVIYSDKSVNRIKRQLKSIQYEPSLKEINDYFEAVDNFFNNPIESSPPRAAAVEAISKYVASIEKSSTGIHSADTVQNDGSIATTDAPHLMAVEQRGNNNEQNEMHNKLTSMVRHVERNEEYQDRMANLREKIFEAKATWATDPTSENQQKIEQLEETYNTIVAEWEFLNARANPADTLYAHEMDAYNNSQITDLLPKLLHNKENIEDSDFVIPFQNNYEPSILKKDFKILESLLAKKNFQEQPSIPATPQEALQTKKRRVSPQAKETVIKNLEFRLDDRRADRPRRFNLTQMHVAYVADSASESYEQSTTTAGSVVNPEQRCIDRIVQTVYGKNPGKNIVVVDLGSHNGKKGIKLCDQLSEKGHDVKYQPMDTSKPILQQAVLNAQKAGYEVVPIFADMNKIAEHIEHGDENYTFIVLGNTPGNQQDNGRSVIRSVRDSMKEGDHIIFSVQLAENIEEMVSFYNNEDNAQFITNIGYAIGFEEGDVTYRATFDPETNDVEGSLHVQNDRKIGATFKEQRVERMKIAGFRGRQEVTVADTVYREHHFIPNDTLVMLKSHKYTRDELHNMFTQEGYDAHLELEDNVAVVSAVPNYQ